MSQIRFLVSPRRRVVMLLLTFIVGLIITGIAGGLLIGMGGNDKVVAMTRIATVVQDVFMLVMPALVTAMIVTRQPVKLLALGKLPGYQQSLVAVLVMIFSAPLMSWIIEMNASIHFPESMAGLETKLRAMEDSAQTTLDLMLGMHNPVNLLINILIIGVLAGFSEELFFRGALQRLLGFTHIGPHASIWIAAIVFSAVHMQFYGFVPRMLLGAYFGYLLLWSGSIWLPMLVHALNNSMFIIMKYMTGTGDPVIGEQGSAESAIAIAVSAALTAGGLWMLYSMRPKANIRPEQ